VRITVLLDLVQPIWLLVELVPKGDNSEELGHGVYHAQLGVGVIGGGVSEAVGVSEHAPLGVLLEFLQDAVNH